MTTTAPDLERLFDLPAVEPDRSNHTFTFPLIEQQAEWIDQCACLVTNGRPLPSDDDKPCVLAAEVNVTLLCRSCGPKTWGFCGEHAQRGLRGDLSCGHCSKLEHRKVKMTPVRAVWREERAT